MIIIQQNLHRIVTLSNDPGGPTDENQLWFELMVVKTERGSNKSEMKLFRFDKETARSLALNINQMLREEANKVK